MKTLLALLCPPLAVALTGRPLTAVLTLALTLLFWVPGMIHAMLIVSQDFREEHNGVRLALRTRESNGIALLALAGLIGLILATWLLWPTVKMHLIDPVPEETEFMLHDYK